MDIPKARKLKEAFDTVLLHLNDEETNAILAVIDRACTRLLKPLEPICPKCHGEGGYYGNDGCDYRSCNMCGGTGKA